MTLLAEREPIEITPRARLGYDVEVVPDTAGGRAVYVARHPDLPGCMSDGATPDEAIENLADARDMYLAGLRGAGLPVPPPKAHAVTRILRSLGLSILPENLASEIAQTPWEIVPLH